MFERLRKRTRAEAHEDIAAIGKVKVAITVMMHARLGDERAAAHTAMAVEPRLRIVTIGIGRKARIRRERVRHPFPHRSAPIDQVQARGIFPLGLARQAASCPSAVGFGLVGVHMADRLIERQRLPAPKPAMLPAISRMAPASWLRELRFVVPGAPLIRPPALVAITACSDKLRVSTIANALAGDARRSQRHLMRPFLVVEHEAMFGLGALNAHASR